MKKLFWLISPKCLLFVVLFLTLRSLLGNCTIQEGGYLGDLGAVEGNCRDFALPPLSAFGSLSINQNAPLGALNRINAHQRPVTNNFQLFQQECAILPSMEWTQAEISKGGNGLNMRAGPFLVGMARTGPSVLIPQYNMNQNAQFPALVTDTRTTIFFSAAEVNQGAANDYFAIQSTIQNTQTCVLTYTPKNAGAGKIIDYNVIGNVFHDVYYENLTPWIASSNALLVQGPEIFISIDNGPIQLVPIGNTIVGRKFQLFVGRVDPLGPSTFIMYAENADATNIEFEIVDLGANVISFNATAPFTGFIRLAALSTRDAAPSSGQNWQQQTYFMPEDTGGADTSNPPAICAVEQTTCMPDNSVQSSSWWNTILVDAISPTGMNLYLLYPRAWTNLATMLAKKQIGANWQLNADPIRFPAAAPMTIILPLLSLQDSATAETYYQDYLSATNPTPPPYNFNGDFSTNFFTLRFDMYMAQNLASEINTFQSGNTMPTYVLHAPVNNSSVYDAYRRYIPVSASIATTADTVSWTYTLSDKVTSGDGQNKPLICFPLWKRLQGSTAGVVNTSPGSGEPLQNFIYNDTIKGSLYAAEATNGKITFLEQQIPSWFTSDDLFIPSTLTFTQDQLDDLEDILTNVIPNQVIPLPYFPELQIDPAYNGGKTAFMLAKTALYIAYFLTENGQANLIDQMTRPYIENAKSVLTAYLVGRIPGESFFVADQTGSGICVNGAGGVGNYAEGPNLQQRIDSGVDFGNYTYNDHHFFAGYYLLAAAMITDWERKYASQESHWIEVPVLGADYKEYKMRDFVDFLWRDAHNPFSNDPDFPYDRQGFQWEGHSIANGLQYEPFALGRNQESIAEDFNCWLGMHAYAQVLLKTSLNSLEQARYQAVRDFSIMNLKLTASSGSVLWYKNPTFWKREPGGAPEGSSIEGAIYIGQFSMTSVTNGQVNDQSAQNQTFF